MTAGFGEFHKIASSILIVVIFVVQAGLSWSTTPYDPKKYGAMNRLELVTAAGTVTTYCCTLFAYALDEPSSDGPGILFSVLSSVVAVFWIGTETVLWCKYKKKMSECTDVLKQHYTENPEKRKHASRKLLTEEEFKHQGASQPQSITPAVDWNKAERETRRDIDEDDYGVETWLTLDQFIFKYHKATDKSAGIRFWGKAFESTPPCLHPKASQSTLP